MLKLIRKGIVYVCVTIVAALAVCDAKPEKPEPPNVPMVLVADYSPQASEDFNRGLDVVGNYVKRSGDFMFGTLTSRVQSGTNAFACVNEGCRFAVGPDTYVDESGTNIRLVTSIVELPNGDPLFYASNANANFNYSTNVSAVNVGTTPSTAAFTFFPQNALDTTDWIFNIGTVSNAASLLSLTYAGNLVNAGDHFLGGGDLGSTLTSQSFFFDTATDDTTCTATQPAYVLSSAVNYTAGDAIFGVGHNGNTNGDRFRVTTYGPQNVVSQATNTTATGQTSVTTGQMLHRQNSATVTEAALAAAATSDEIIFTVAAKTRVLRLIADVTATFAGGGITDMDVTCGTTAGGNQYLVTFDVDTAIGTYGDVAAEIGAGLLSATVADIPSWSATTDVQCRFTCAGANCDAATTGSMTLYLEYLVFQ